MQTTGSFGVLIDGTYKMTPILNSVYPEVMGEHLVWEIREFINRVPIEMFRKRARLIEMVEFDHPDLIFAQTVDSLLYFFNLCMMPKLSEDNDPLLCEYSYVVDLDNEKFIVYRDCLKVVEYPLKEIPMYWQIRAWPDCYLVNAPAASQALH